MPLHAKWNLSSFLFTRSQHGDKIDERDKIKCPEGWEWASNWEVDDNRAVDDEGETLLIRNSLPRTKTLNVN